MIMESHIFTKPDDVFWHWIFHTLVEQTLTRPCRDNVDTVTVQLRRRVFVATLQLALVVQIDERRPV